LKGTIFVLTNKTPGQERWMADNNPATVPFNINHMVAVIGHISVKDMNAAAPPLDLPAAIEKAWNEGARCMAVDCPNAAASMFRLCIDLATKALVPPNDTDGLNATIRRSLGLRLEWLFRTGRLPAALQDLSHAVKDDGNDGAHDGTLTKLDGEDLQDFTFALLDRLYSEPARIEAARLRREARRNPTTNS
jgi:hypothetical protein